LGAWKATKIGRQRSEPPRAIHQIVVVWASRTHKSAELQRLALPPANLVEAGELNRTQGSDVSTEKPLDFPAKSSGYGDFFEDHIGPKTAAKHLQNPEKPDRVRSVKRKPGKR
jgi:hypothetical protein